MSSHPKTYIGCFIQVHKPKGNADLDKILHEDFEEQLIDVPSECFDVNRTVIIPNIKDRGIIIDCDYQEGNVWNLEDLNIQNDMGRFERRFKKNIDVLKENFDDVKIRYGVIHYWR